MATASVRLTDQENQALQELAQKTGKTQDELLHEAVTRFLSEVGIRRLSFLRHGRGIWKERTDRPDPRALRAELDRLSS